MLYFCVCCAEKGAVSFNVYREVRDLQNPDEYFMDAGCVAVGNNSSLIDIEWFNDGKKIDPSPFVSIISISAFFNQTFISPF